MALVRRRFEMTGGARTIGVSAVAAVLAFAVASCTSAPDVPSAAPSRPHLAQSHRDPTTTTTGPVDPGGPVPAAGTLVAHTDGSVPAYASPGAPVSDGTVPGTWYGYPSILPVVATAPGWVEVRLAQRPNGSTAWVQQNDVTLDNTSYFMVVNLATMRLTVYENGSQILDFPAGIGSPDDPTPTGDFFVAMTVPPPDPSYGPFVLATSDHSDAITDWEESGDAIIGIHGPITAGADADIGTTGAAISHGCIRLHDADLAQLATIPPGTPLDIVSS